IDDLQPVDVFDQAAGHFAPQRAAVAYHIHPQGAARGDRDDEAYAYDEQQQGVGNDAGTEQPAAHLALGQAFGDGAARGIADKAPGVIHFVHHLIAGVDTGPAAYAHVLQPVADVDAGGTDLHAQRAVDAVAQPRFFVVDAARPPPARLAALVV